MVGFFFWSYFVRVNEILWMILQVFFGGPIALEDLGFCLQRSLQRQKYKCLCVWDDCRLTSFLPDFFGNISRHRPV